MFQSLKDLFRPSFLFRPRDVHVHPLDDQNNLRNANPAPPTPGRPPGTDAESSNRLSKTFRELAAKLRPSFPQACSWLAPTDLQDIEDNPVDGGRFADVWKGRLQARDIAIKSYRCYVRFDCDQVRMVSSKKNSNTTHTRTQLTPCPEVFEGSTRIQPPLASEHCAVLGRIQYYKASVLLGVRLHGTPQPV